jgi:C-22 sterol desaturase
MTQLDTSGLLSTVFNGLTFWKALLTLLLAAVVYDQGESRCTSPSCAPPVLIASQQSTSGRRAPSSAPP